jgi:hypothetical protein
MASPFREGLVVKVSEAMRDCKVGVAGLNRMIDAGRLGSIRIA